MRRTLLFLLLLSLVTVGSVSAAVPRDAYVGETVAIAWMEGDILNVALGNESNFRSTVTISTDTLDSRWRPVFRDRTVSVPSRTIVVESFRPSVTWRNEAITVNVRERGRSVNIPVQTSDMMKPTTYILEANSLLEVTADLSFLLDGERRVRLIVDDFYEATASGRRGRIQVKTFEGGLTYRPSNNSIEYVSPYMVLSMRAPQVNGLASMTFSLHKESDGYWGYNEEIAGPTVLVYGRNIRYGRSSTVPDDSGWISK